MGGLGPGGGLFPGFVCLGSLSGGLCPLGSLSRGVSVQGVAAYWNAFLFSNSVLRTEIFG